MLRSNCKQSGKSRCCSIRPVREIGPRPRTRKRNNFLYSGCDFSGWYNFQEIIKIVDTGCHILKLKCTKFDFGWGSAPDPAAGAYSALPDSLAGFQGAYF